MPKRILVLLLSLFCALPALADSEPHWLQVNTPNFTVITDGSAGQARQVAAQFERMHALFAQLLPGARDDAGSRIMVLAFKNRKGFQAVEPAAYLQKNSLDLAGLFLSRPDKSFILLRLDTTGEHPYETVYHEYTHYMVRHATSLPLWLNEGLAQFYQNTELDETTARIGEPNSNELYFLRQQRLIPLTTLFAVGHDSPFYHEEDKGNIFYAESWALTHYLMIQDRMHHTTLLRDYAARVGNGEDAVTAAQQTFGDLRQLQTTLDGYVNQGSYMALKMTLPNKVKEADFHAEPIQSADADAVRAEVLVEDGRQADGRALAAAVLQANPDSAEAHESMGLLEFRDGHVREARKWYGQAVALHSKSYLAYYYFGALSQQLGGGSEDAPSDESVGASLQEAVKLNPTFAPAAEALARFQGAHGQLDEATLMMVRAVELDPANIEYRLDAAQIRVQRKEWASAISILKAADKIPGRPEDHERVEARLASLERYQARLTATQARQTSPAADLASVASPSDMRSSEPGHLAPVKDSDGHVLNVVVPGAGDHHFPTGPPAGPKHTVKGVLRSVSCFYPKGLTLNVDGSAANTPLYSNDMYAIHFTAANFTPGKELNPCQQFEGMKASVVYAEVKDATVAGQIVSMELSK